jgi:predicted methyltransferase
MLASIHFIRRPILKILSGAISTQGLATSIFREQKFNAAKYPAERMIQADDFRWQLANSEPAGTSETSQIATDHIFNPNTINNIADLNDRPTHPEVTADGVHRNVYHILKDGADSVGSACLDDPAPHPGPDDTACARTSRIR